jgi:hypothetical protein
MAGRCDELLGLSHIDQQHAVAREPTLQFCDLDPCRLRRAVTEQTREQ